MKLLRIELLKLRAYVPLRIMLGIFLVLLPFGLYAVDTFLQNLEMEGVPEDFKLQLVQLPDFWYHLTYHASWYNMLFGIIAVILVTNEVSFKTLRQNVIDGLERKDLVSSKLLVLGLITLAAGLYVGLVGFAFILTSGLEYDAGMLFEKIAYLPALMFQMFWYMCAGMLTGLLIKRAGLAILLYLFAIPADFFLNSILAWLAPTIKDVAPFSAASSVIDFWYYIPHVLMPMPSFEFGMPFFVACAWLVAFISASYASVKSGDI